MSTEPKPRSWMSGMRIVRVTCTNCKTLLGFAMMRWEGDPSVMHCLQCLKATADKNTRSVQGGTP